MSDTYRCQMSRALPCGQPAAYSLTYTLTNGGAQFTNAYCRSCVSPRTDQVRAEGGEILACRDLPPPPPPIEPAPVGLDAVDSPSVVADTRAGLSDFEQWIAWPEWARDAIVSDTVIRFGWKDRLLILIGRPLVVTSKTWTSEAVGRTDGMTRQHVLDIRWPWSRRSFGVAEAEQPPAGRG